jgi:hypothetical protein
MYIDFDESTLIIPKTTTCYLFLPIVVVFLTYISISLAYLTHSKNEIQVKSSWWRSFCDSKQINEWQMIKFERVSAKCQIVAHHVSWLFSNTTFLIFVEIRFYEKLTIVASGQLASDEEFNHVDNWICARLWRWQTTAEAGTTLTRDEKREKFSKKLLISGVTSALQTCLVPGTLLYIG